MNRAVQTAMIEKGVTAESLAEQLGVDPKTAGRWVNPGRVPQPRHRVRVAEILGRDVTELWPDLFRRRDPVWFRPWADIEREATALRSFELSVIPGLLQTEEYARAVITSGPLATAGPDKYVDARLRRQRAVFERPHPPMAIFVIDEVALRRGDPALLGPQLDHLVTMARRPHIMVHVLPLTAGVHPGQAGPFVIATTQDGDVGYLDDQATGRITEDVAPLWAVWDTVRSLSLPRDLTIDFLEARAWMS